MDPASFAIMMDTISRLAGGICAIALFGLLVLLVVWVVKIRTGPRLNKQDAAAMQEMVARLQQMDQRMAMLEKILDAEVPSWRGNVDHAGGDYARQAG
jgi:phage shock protein B